MQRTIIKDKRPLMERITAFVARIDDKIGVEQALLFGSTAKRKRRRTSDVDLIIVSKAFNSVPHHERPGVLENMWNYKEELETLTYTPEEFEQVKSRLLMKEILSYAIDLTPRLASKAKFKKSSKENAFES